MDKGVFQMTLLSRAICGSSWIEMEIEKSLVIALWFP